MPHASCAQVWSEHDDMLQLSAKSGAQLSVNMWSTVLRRSVPWFSLQLWLDVGEVMHRNRLPICGPAMPVGLKMIDLRSASAQPICHLTILLCCWFQR